MHKPSKTGWTSRHPARVQALLAVVALLLGVLVYVFDRDPERTYFLSSAFSLRDAAVPVFGELGKHLPDFLHIYAFILLTCAVLRPGHKDLLKIVSLWLVIELFFEIGQHPALAPSLAGMIPPWFLNVPVLENSAEYLLRGMFDPLDLLAILAGAIAAFLTVRFMPAYS